MMPRTLAFLVALALLIAPRVAGAQGITARRVAPGEVPRDVVYRGRVEGARRWTDRTGDNLLLLTRTDVVTKPGPEDEDPHREREIHAYHYVREGAGYRLLWRTADFVRECPLDLALEYAPGSLQVTDVDADGIAETSYVYRLACQGGVDPSELKLILHEGATKYAIRGSGDLRDAAPGDPAPEMRMDAALRREPALRALAERQWRRFVREMRWPDEGAP